MLADEQIDGLSGFELDRVVAIECGWSLIGIWWQSPDGRQWASPHPFHCSDDLGLALLKREDAPPIGIFLIDGIEIIDFSRDDDDHLRLLATGPMDQFATLACRAFLKLKNREDQSR